MYKEVGAERTPVLADFKAGNHIYILKSLVIHKNSDFQY